MAAEPDSRLALFTDVHADEDAMLSILAAASRTGINRLWCLGDYASGGPAPRATYDLVHRHCELVLAGNHERFVVERVWQQVSAPWADAAYDASVNLGAERRDNLATLYSGIERPEEGITVVHGSMTDPADDAIRTPAEALVSMSKLRTQLLLFGHTHYPAFWRSYNGGLPDRPDSLHLGVAYPLELHKPGIRVALNPGAGCDGKGARWLELDLAGEGSATWHQTDTPGHNGVYSEF